MKILLIEDEKILRVSLIKALRKAGYAVHPCSDGKKGAEALGKEVFDVVLTDLRLPGYDGIEILRRVKKRSPSTHVVLMTAYATVESAVEALKMGAHDYLTKPFSQEELLHRMAQLDSYQSLLSENRELKGRLSEKHEIIGNAPSFRRSLERIHQSAPGEHTVLLEGESGTGKELIADLLHDLSARKGGPLIKVSCSALPESLFESELFGHEKGAFTGAAKRSIGRFERADGGTIFLDDIDDLPKPLQVKLLRAIEEREIERVGGQQTISVDVRIVAATKVDLRHKMEEGEFRDDLFYRLNVVNVQIPPLRERQSDIPLLAAHSLDKFGDGYTMTPALLERFMEYQWPGNVRELENVIIQMIALAQEKTLEASLLPSHFHKPETALIDADASSLTEATTALEKSMILEALEKCKWRQKDAAEMLKVPRTTLRSKMQRYGLTG